VIPPVVASPLATQVQRLAPDLHHVRDKLSVLLEGMLEGVPYTDKEGNVVMINGTPLLRAPDAATLSVIRQFLRDNGCVSDAMPATGKPVAEGLPFDESDGSGKNDTPAPDDLE
jgi:hypothetical protein